MPGGKGIYPIADLPVAPLRADQAMQIPTMKAAQRLTAIIECEDDGFAALCPELDVASQGTSIEEALANPIEALALFFEMACPLSSHGALAARARLYFP
jgi:predicted RNase H-like HicB family nuclease